MQLSRSLSLFLGYRQARYGPYTRPYIVNMRSLVELSRRKYYTLIITLCWQHFWQTPTLFGRSFRLVQFETTTTSRSTVPMGLVMFAALGVPLSANKHESSKCCEQAFTRLAVRCVYLYTLTVLAMEWASEVVSTLRTIYRWVELLTGRLWEYCQGKFACGTPRCKKHVGTRFETYLIIN